MQSTYLRREGRVSSERRNVKQKFDLTACERMLMHCQLNAVLLLPHGKDIIIGLTELHRLQSTYQLFLEVQNCKFVLRYGLLVGKLVSAEVEYLFGGRHRLLSVRGDPCSVCVKIMFGTVRWTGEICSIV